MSTPTQPSGASETNEGTRPGAVVGTVSVHYWAGAKAAAGVAGDDLRVDGPLTLTEVVRRAVALHPGTNLADVLRVCSTLVGDRPVGADDPDDVQIAPGSSVEFLPPFAGG